MAQKYILALDQGTTSSRSIVFNHRGEVVASCSEPFDQLYPKPGWVEHDANQIWNSQLHTAREVLRQADLKIGDIAAIGIANQRETTVVWDRNSGEPVCNAIVWQCRRTAEYCDRLKAENFDRTLKEKTGLVADAYFSGTKAAWILNHVPGAREKAEKGSLAFGTIDSWLVYKLSGCRTHITDYSNASRTLLYNIHDLKWDTEILRRFDIPASMLPEVRPSSHVYTVADPKILGAALPISGMAGDQQAALFGQCCFDPGMTKNTYGTGCFLLMNTGTEPKRSESGLLTTIAWGIDGRVEYALEGSIFIAGAVIQWLRDELKLIDTAAETEALAALVEDANGVYIVPAFVGLGAPYWDPYARGSILGLTRGANRSHIVRAALESIAFQTKDVVDCISHDSGLTLSELRIDGGASANNFLCQFQADLLQTKVTRPKILETTARGAAYLAGLAVGFWKGKEELIRNVVVDREFFPRMPLVQRQNLLRGWQRAVDRSRGWERVD
ncbi:MAG: glycerol kinase [Deltaproteobacteria bacterium HGW-Deltaproteobacteria-21]|nr:MAG: glycerol kinase [Deltaproteobacteria bacterium HGW-Deltaproteobacteria-21]